MPLIERGETALGAQVEPVLRDGQVWRRCATGRWGRCVRTILSGGTGALAAQAASSSMDFENVYCKIPVKPLCSRRRNWIARPRAWNCRWTSDRQSPPGRRHKDRRARPDRYSAENSCGPRVPLMPRYVAVICSDPGRSRCSDTCQFCAYPTRKFGSTAKVLPVTSGDAMKPLASVSGSAGLFCTLRLFESGGCWAICAAMFGRPKCRSRRRSRRESPSTIRRSDATRCPRAVRTRACRDAPADREVRAPRPARPP